MQKAGRACAECARQGGETPSLRGPGIRGACIQGFGPKKKKNDHQVEQVWVEVLKVSPKKFYISDQMKMKMNHVKNGNIVFT